MLDKKYHRILHEGPAQLTMDRVAQRLAAGETFIRVRRSAIINVRAVASLERYGKGTLAVQLRSGPGSFPVAITNRQCDGCPGPTGRKGSIPSGLPPRTFPPRLLHLYNTSKSLFQ